MNPVFADTAYWIAINSPSDSLHTVAVSVSRQVGSRSIVTSQMVLTEFLDGAATRGAGLRREAARFARILTTLPSVQVIPQTSELFAAALALYEQRLDKEWSLTDCASFVICRQEGIQDVLTYDQHFVQMGLNALLRTPEA